MANRMASAIANRMAKLMANLWQNYAPNPNPNPNPKTHLPAPVHFSSQDQIAFSTHPQSVTREASANECAAARPEVLR